MMHRYTKHIVWEPSALILAAFFLMLLPLRWFAAFLIAAVIHELGHIGMILLLRGRISEVRIGGCGAVIQSSAQEEWKNILCSFAGPIASLCLIVFVRSCPRIAICGIIQGVYNLLPLPFLDGGRVVKSFLNIFRR